MVVDFRFSEQRVIKNEVGILEPQMQRRMGQQYYLNRSMDLKGSLNIVIFHRVQNKVRYFFFGHGQATPWAVFGIEMSQTGATSAT